MSIEDLGEAQEVEPPRERGQLARLLIVLVVAGAVLGGIVAGFTGFATSFAQTEAGLCRVLPAPCTSLPLTSVEHFAGVDLPADTRVVTAYSQEALGELVFRAEVVLPAASGNPLPPVYQLIDGDWSEDISAAIGLSDLSYWVRDLGDGVAMLAAIGTDEQSGETVLHFDTGR